jgi:hypothetical protein
LLERSKRGERTEFENDVEKRVVFMRFEKKITVTGIRDNTAKMAIASGISRRSPICDRLRIWLWQWRFSEGRTRLIALSAERGEIS